MKNILKYKKNTTTFHIISGALTLFFLLLLFRQHEKYGWIYITAFFLFITSGISVYTIFYNTLGFFEKSYFGFLFAGTILTIGFFIFTTLFDLYFFG